MRIDVAFIDRVGIAHEILAVLAARRLNVTAVEVSPPHVFIDAPDLAEDVWADLRDALLAVAGVRAATRVDILPVARDRLHLEALLSAMPDPVLLVDADGTVLIANAATLAVSRRKAETIGGVALGDLFSDARLQVELVRSGFRTAPREVSLGGVPFQLDVVPVFDDGVPAGGVVTLWSPHRLGERMRGLQTLPEHGFEAILGASPAIQSLKKRAARVADVDAPILILGETGTGKELVAQACHQASRRRDAPFLALNCAAVPENLAESELFGYASGAFSGATRGGKPGLLELADKGTVFLDEIGEMSPYLQSKLLRFLNDGSFRRVGAERESRVDVRIVSATHRDLEAMVKAGTFREDLFYRLNVLRLELPPLRERGDDVVRLARHFVARASAQCRRAEPRLSPAAEAELRRQPWPGNVRQLENVVFRAVTMSDQPVLEPADLVQAGHAADVGAEVVAGEIRDWDGAVRDFEKALLTRLYPQFPSSRKLAARLATSHTTIADRLRRYGLTKP